MGMRTGVHVLSSLLHNSLPDSPTARRPDANRAMGETVEKEKARAKVTDAKGVLQQNREFLDFFWDIAKPEQEVRLGAVEHLVQYLRSSDKVGGSVHCVVKKEPVRSQLNSLKY